MSKSPSNKSNNKSDKSSKSNKEQLARKIVRILKEKYKPFDTSGINPKYGPDKDPRSG